VINNPRIVVAQYRQRGAVFNQILNPTGQLYFAWLIALVPVVLLLALLAVFRLSAWLADRLRHS
jgi:hypothetical protein